MSGNIQLSRKPQASDDSHFLSYRIHQGWCLFCAPNYLSQFGNYTIIRKSYQRFLLSQFSRSDVGILVPCNYYQPRIQMIARCFKLLSVKYCDVKFAFLTSTTKSSKKSFVTAILFQEKVFNTPEQQRYTKFTPDHLLDYFIMASECNYFIN